MRGRKGGGVGAKGKGDLRRGGEGAGEERSDDEEERMAEKGDERERRGELGVWGGTFTGHLEFAVPTTDGIRASFPLWYALLPPPLLPPVPSAVPRSTVVLVPCHPRLEVPTVHPRAAN